MLRKRKQQNEKRKGTGVIAGKKYIKIPHPHHRNKILKSLNDLHILSNTVNKMILAAALHSAVVTASMQQH